MLMLTTIANFIIRSSIVAPNQSSLKPDTHDETFVCNLCMQLLCVPYTTVQTMQLHITCCSFPLKLCILFQLVLTERAEEDEIAVPLCLMIIALATQHLNGPRIIRSLDSTNKCI